VGWQGSGGAGRHAAAGPLMDPAGPGPLPDQVVDQVRWLVLKGVRNLRWARDVARTREERACMYATRVAVTVRALGGYEARGHGGVLPLLVLACQLWVQPGTPRLLCAACPCCCPPVLRLSDRGHPPTSTGWGAAPATSSLLPQHTNPHTPHPNHGARPPPHTLVQALEHHMRGVYECLRMRAALQDKQHGLPQATSAAVAAHSKGAPGGRRGQQAPSNRLLAQRAPSMRVFCSV